jgi:tetratricopeptide (TPR) repeat protein
VEPQLVTTLFSGVDEYLHFVRNLTTFSRTSADGTSTASLTKEDGWYYWYRLRIAGGPVYVQNVHRFRANKSRLEQFHAGCAAAADHVRQCLDRGERSLLRNEELFGELSGDFTREPDDDEWEDRVECSELRRRLHRVDGHDQDGDERAAWCELQSVSQEHEFNVEVLRRRLIYCHYAESVDHAALTRWARALVEAEPYDVNNWMSLEHAVAGPDGENTEAAVAVLREAIRRKGSDFVLYYSLASRLCRLDFVQEAREAMRLALKEDPCAIDCALDSACFAPIWEYLCEYKEQHPRD